MNTLLFLRPQRATAPTHPRLLGILSVLVSWGDMGARRSRTLQNSDVFARPPKVWRLRLRLGMQGLLCALLSGTSCVAAAADKTEADTKPWKPTVAMTDEHRATCLVYRGDVFPEFALPDLDGNRQSTGRLLGKKRTVVVFWTTKHAYAFEQFRNLNRDVVRPFSDKDVAIIAINEGDPIAQVKELSANAPGVVHLHDDDGEALKKVATSRLPRTYLLDDAGKILWMDIEYSQSTRRELRNALRYFGQ